VTDLITLTSIQSSFPQVISACRNRFIEGSFLLIQNLRQCRLW
jgi:hypothetical protein